MSLKRVPEVNLTGHQNNELADSFYWLVTKCVSSPVSGELAELTAYGFVEVRETFYWTRIEPGSYPEGRKSDGRCLAECGVQ